MVVKKGYCTHYYYLLGKGDYFFGNSVGLSVCLFICLFVCGHYSKSYEQIGMKFYGGVLRSRPTVKN